MWHEVYVVIRFWLMYEFLRTYLVGRLSEMVGTKCPKCRFRIAAFKACSWVSRKLARFPRLSRAFLLGGFVLGNADLIFMLLKTMREEAKRASVQSNAASARKMGATGR